MSVRADRPGDQRDAHFRIRLATAAAGVPDQHRSNPSDSRSTTPTRADRRCAVFVCGGASRAPLTNGGLGIAGRRRAVGACRRPAAKGWRFRVVFAAMRGSYFGLRLQRGATATCRRPSLCLDAIASALPALAAAYRLYEGGWVVNVVGGSGVRVLGRVVGGERRSSLYCLLGGRTRRHWRPAPRAQVRKGRQAARRKAAPLGAVVGAKDSLLVSMCQIASVSFLATSIWATLAPRCLPSRCLLRW